MLEKRESKIVVRIFVMIFLAGLTVGCVSFPEPQADTDSLVVVGFTLDFPDGFFDRGPKTVAQGVTVLFEEQGTGRRFFRETRFGYATFVADAAYTYRLISFGYEEKVGGRRTYTLGGIPLEIEFHPAAKAVSYIGDIEVVYNAPTVSDRATVRNNSSQREYKMDVSLAVDNRPESAIEHLERIEPETAWLNYALDTSNADRLGSEGSEIVTE